MLEHLSHGSTSVVVGDGDGSPRVYYWGPALPASTDLDAMVAALDRGRAHGSMDREGPLTLVPEHARGFPGVPGILGARRDGSAWAPRFEMTDFVRTGDVLRSTSFDPVAGLCLRSTIALGDALKVSVEIENTGTTPYEVQALCVTLPLPAHAVELLAFDGRWAKEMQPTRTIWGRGAIVSENRRGRTSHDRPPIILAGSSGFGEWSGEVWGAHLAWSGNSKVLAEVLADGRRYLQLGELLHPGEVVLEPGERYPTQEVIAVHSPSGVAAASWAYHRAVRAAARPTSVERAVLINTWEAVYFDHENARLTRLAELAAGCGVELFVLDDGWFSSRRSDRSGLGDWWVSPDAYPEGLGPLIARVRSLGMRFGIWVEPEMANPDSELVRQHPDWVLGTRGYETLLGRNQVVVDLTNPEAFENVLSALDRLLSAHDITYLKWDMNRDLVQGSRASGRSGAHDQTLAVYALLDEVRRRHPGVDVEGCSSGGGRVDLGMLARTERVWASDCNDPLERQTIQRSLSLVLPAEFIGSHIGPPRAHTTGRRHSLAFRCATALFGHLGVEWNLLDASEEDLAGLKNAIALHKRFRPLLHSGDTVRLEHPDVALLLHGVYATDRSEALLCVVQMDTSVALPGTPIRLPGLPAQSRYRISVVPITGWDTATGPAVSQPAWVTGGITLSGAQLASHGLQPPILHPEQVLLVQLTECGSTVRP